MPTKYKSNDVIVSRQVVVEVEKNENVSVSVDVRYTAALNRPNVYVIKNHNGLKENS